MFEAALVVLGVLALAAVLVRGAVYLWTAAIPLCLAQLEWGMRAAREGAEGTVHPALALIAEVLPAGMAAIAVGLVITLTLVFILPGALPKLAASIRRIRTRRARTSPAASEVCK